MNSTAQLARDPQEPLPTGPTHVAFRSTRTPAQVESNSAFLSDAGRVEFGRYEATLERVWMAFAYFASLSDGRTCYATVEHIAEKARRSGRTVRRHVPALMARGLVECSARQGGHTPSRWSVVIPADVRAGRTGCPGRADTVSANIRDTGKRERARPLQGRRAHSNVRVVHTKTPWKPPVTTAAPMKGSPVPSIPPLTVVARPDQSQPHIDAMREIVQRNTAATPAPRKHPPSTSIQTPKHASSNKTGCTTKAKKGVALSLDIPPIYRGGCPHCGHDRMMGGSCNECGYDDQTGFRPSADCNKGG